MYTLRTAVCLFFFFISFITPAQAKQKIILEVIVNELSVGQLFFTLEADGSLWASEKTLETMRLRRQAWVEKKQANGLVSLNALAPKLTYTLDEHNGQLRVQVEPSWFVPQVVEGGRRNQASAEATTEPYSAFLNYQAQPFFDDRQGFVGLDAPYNLGINFKHFIIDNSFNAAYRDGRLSNRRLLSSLRWDEPQTMQTVVLGDVAPRGQRLFSGMGILGGVSWRKNFQLNRYAHSAPELELRTAVTSPAHARVYVNGLLVKETDVLPGEVILNQLPVAAVQGQAQVVLTDSFGHEQTISEPFYLMYNQLKKGLHDYEYNLGFVRQELGLRDFAYGDLTLQGFHRYGFSNATTIGLAGVKQSRYTLLNPQIQTTLGQYQQLELDAAFSQYKGKIGTAYEARYRFQVGGLQLQASSAWNDKRYTGFGPDGAPFRNRLNATLRYGTPGFGTLNLSYNQVDGWQQDFSDKGLQLSYGRRLFEGVYLTATVQQSLSRNETGGFLSFEYRPTLSQENPNPLFDNLRGTVRYASQGDRDFMQEELDINRSSYLYNYSAQLVQQEGNVIGNVRGQYKTDHHLYAAALNRSEDHHHTAQLMVAGGIAALRQGIYFGRPVTDSFAVVHVENSDKPTLIRANDMTIMETESDTVLLPEFASYSTYQLGIQSKRFNNLKDIRYNLENAQQPLVIAKRGGAFLDLKINRIFAVEGNIYIAKGKKEYLALMPIQFSVDGKTQDSFTGEKGYFYLENLKPGRHVLTVIRREGDCQATLTIPQTDKNMVNVGEIACVMH